MPAPFHDVHRVEAELIDWHVATDFKDSGMIFRNEGYCHGCLPFISF